jgi:ribosome maturation factor RimP
MGSSAHFLFVATVRQEDVQVGMQLVEIIEQAVTGLGYELVDFETSPRGRLLRVFIDRLPEQGSINIDDCTTVSNQLTRLFTVENIDYDRLEVSSPGLDRPLKKPADWLRFAGEDVQFKLRVPVGNQRNFAGLIVGANGDSAVVRVDGEDRDFPLEGIEKARLVPKLGFRDGPSA